MSRNHLSLRVAFTILFFICFAEPTWNAGPQQQEGATPPPTPLLTFHSDAVIITVLIKPDRTADFEMVLAKLKEALNRSEKPERQQQAEGWSVFKATQMMNGNVAYIMTIDPVVRGQEYDITRLIAEVFPVEVQEVFPRYKDAFTGRAISELTRLMSFAQ